MLEIKTEYSPYVPAMEPKPMVYTVTADGYEVKWSADKEQAVPGSVWCYVPKCLTGLPSAADMRILAGLLIEIAATLDAHNGTQANG